MSTPESAAAPILEPTTQKFMDVAGGRRRTADLHIEPGCRP